MSSCHDKDILKNVILAFKMSLLSERHLMTVVINPSSCSRHMSCHGYEGVMPVLCTPLQVKCYRLFMMLLSLINDCFKMNLMG